jgi:AdoMet-dependent heme synthase
METKNFIHNFFFYFQRPTQVQIDITNKCNLKCIYCYNYSNEFLKEELSNDNFRIVVDKVITQLNPVFVSFSGGEPFTRKELLFESIDKIKKNNIGVHINTNALLITREDAEKLKELKVDKININIESNNPKSHDTLRGLKGAYELLQEKLEILKETVGPEKISLAVVVTKKNIDDLFTLAQKVKKEGFMELHLLDMIPTDKNDTEYLPSKEDWKKFYANFKDILDLGINIKPNHALLFMEHFKKKTVLPFCMAGRLKMVICANGNVVPCNYFKDKEFLCGNALQENLLEIWQDSEVMVKFRYSMDGYESCAGCDFVEKCAGGCKALAKGFGHDPFFPDPYCKEYGFSNE